MVFSSPLLAEQHDASKQIAKDLGRISGSYETCKFDIDVDAFAGIFTQHYESYPKFEYDVEFYGGIAFGRLYAANVVQKASFCVASKERAKALDLLVE